MNIAVIAMINIAMNKVTIVMIVTTKKVVKNQTNNKITKIISHNYHLSKNKKITNKCNNKNNILLNKYYLNINKN